MVTFLITAVVYKDQALRPVQYNGTARIRHKCRKATVLSCNRCLINTGVEKNEHYLDIDLNF